MIADKPPVIRFSGEPKQAVNGTLELNYEIEDDYGAASATTEFALEQPPAKDAYPLYKAPEMPLALPRRGAGGKAAAKSTRDLTEHVWAGASIKLTLKTVDDAGHEARSETKTMLLPQRPFSNPLARGGRRTAAHPGARRASEASRARPSGCNHAAGPKTLSTACRTTWH